MASGFIQLNRSLFDHPAWVGSTPEQKIILLTIIVKANYKPASWEWNGEVINVERGQLITSVDKLVIAGGRGMTISKVRTALKRFEKYGFLTIKTSSQSTLITVDKYDDFTSCVDELDKRTDKQIANDYQTDDKRIATTNKYNKDNMNNKRGRKSEKTPSSLQEKTSDVIRYFNEVAGTSFNENDTAYINLISEHLEKGHTVEQLKQIIDRKVREWSDPNNTNDMTSNIKPTTILSPKRFDEYLNAPSGTHSVRPNRSDLEKKITDLRKRLDNLTVQYGDEAHKLDEYLVAQNQLEGYQNQLEKYQMDNKAC